MRVCSLRELIARLRPTGQQVGDSKCGGDVDRLGDLIAVDHPPELESRDVAHGRAGYVPVTAAGLEYVKA